MAKASTIYLKSILEHKDIGAKLRTFFERFFEDINEAARKIPIFLQVCICCKDVYISSFHLNVIVILLLLEQNMV